MVGVHAPAKTPRAIVAKWNDAIVRISKTPDYEESLRAVGLEGAASTPEELDRFVRSEVAKYTKVIKETGMDAR
jgi:tripartite-type tricarboxylate transporter receptor subunit TctC